MSTLRPLFLLFSFVWLVATSSFAQITILSGFEDGSYYSMSSDLKKLIAKEKETLKILPSEGNYYNFQQLLNLDESNIDAVFLQYDVLFAGTYGESSEAVNNIRVLLPLGKEDIHLITTKNSGVKTLKDLEGKNVGVGIVNQGTYVTALFIKKYSGVNWNDVQVSFNESIAALIGGQLDAFFFVGSSPVSKLKDVAPTIADNLALASITNERLETIYLKTVIKAGSYPWLTQDVETLSLGFSLATNIKGETEEDRRKLEVLVSTIKNNMDVLQKTGHPAWKDVIFKFDNLNVKFHDVTKKVFGLK